jgi:predicted XRE-type DNA-binding protein
MHSADPIAGAPNVLLDLELQDAEELSAKALLAVKLNDIIDGRGLTQVEVAQLTGMPQSKVSLLRHYKLQNMSLERLMLALVALDQHVEISVSAARRSKPRGISVAA